MACGEQFGQIGRRTLEVGVESPDVIAAHERESGLERARLADRRLEAHRADPRIPACDRREDGARVVDAPVVDDDQLPRERDRLECGVDVGHEPAEVRGLVAGRDDYAQDDIGAVRPVTRHRRRP
jgi:hypothetical protein